MELRRALLLFAIVLGVAAIATSVSRPPPERVDDTVRSTQTPEQASPQAGSAPAASRLPEVVFRAGGARPKTERLPVGRAATLEVEVSEPGDVVLEGLGLSATADERTPARFEVLPSVSDRHDVRFRPASGEGSTSLGVLAVGAPPTERRRRRGSDRRR